MDDSTDLAAGGFSAWLLGIQAALAGRGESDVPCGTCTGCCTSSQFIHIAPDETDTLACIPAELRFAAPRMPRGHVLMGYDERGHCPMLVDDLCSIYEHRPRTCRTYDCRVFTAAGLEPDDSDKLAIASQVRRWRFGHPTDLDRIQHDAVRAAASYLQKRSDLLPEGVSASNTTQVAVLAIEAHGAFLSRREPEPQAVRVELSRRRS
ncbi:MAG: YkgJ family cysteine cluster protein [Ilumatobacteraceae bacterium]